MGKCNQKGKIFQRHSHTVFYFKLKEEKNLAPNRVTCPLKCVVNYMSTRLILGRRIFLLQLGGGGVGAL